MKTAVIYARVSTGKQEKEGFSIPAQIKFLKEYAQKNSFKGVEMFVEAETAKKAGRKQFSNMLEYISKHRVNALLVEKTDRIYRNFKDYVLLDEFKDLEMIFADYERVATLPKGEDVVDLNKYLPAKKSLIMFGSEADGLSEELIAFSNDDVKIEMMENVESLNLSISCGVVLYKLLIN